MALPSARATRPTAQAPAGLGDSASIANAAHTPGPWRWEVNRKSKTVHLCGGPPKHGFGRYDLTVLSFRRYGMTGASPVFWNWNMERWVGRPERADALAVSVEGREHHADWFADINHPDARLIAAAPELFDAAVLALELIEGGRIYEQQCCGGQECGCRGSTYADEAEHFLRSAISAAQGTPTRSAMTEGHGPKDGGPVPQGCAQNTPDPNPNKEK